MLLLVPVTAQAQSVGIAAGANFSSVEDVDIGDARASYENRSGYHLGLYVDVPVGPIAVRPGIRYIEAGRLFSGFSDAVDEGDPDLGEEFDDFNVSMFTIPIDVRIRLPFPLIKPYAFAGPELRFPNAGDDDSELADDLEDSEVAGNLGLGAQISLPGVGMTLTPEIRYAIGLTGLMGDDITVGDRTFDSSDGQNMNTFFVTLGVEF